MLGDTKIKKRGRPRETEAQKIKRKQREYLMAWLRTASAILSLLVGFIGLGISILIFIKVYGHG